MLLYKVSENLKLLNFDPGQSKKIAVAVSGGPDSIGLSLILRKLLPEHQITILIVNHYLRQDIQKEINFVQYFAKKIHSDFFLLKWQEGKNQISNIQSKAREARYHLLTEKCSNLSIQDLFIAHQQDDFIENYIIRQKRKSSIFGLSANYVHFINNIRILKPLFNISKEQIINFLYHENTKYFHDISNDSNKYLRNRIRKCLTSTKIKSEILHKIQNVNSVAKKLSSHLIEIIATAVKFFNSGFIIINFDKFQNIEDILKIQVLIYCISLVSAKNHAPRYRNINNIIKILSTTNFCIQNLHGVVIEKIQKTLFIYKDYLNILHKKENLYQILTNAQSWNNRFVFSVNPPIEDWIKFFGQDKLKSLNICSIYHLYSKFLPNKDLLEVFIKKFITTHNLNHMNLNNRICKKILFTIPGIFDLEKYLIIPHINYGGLNERFFKNFVFKPNFIYRFTHYFW